MDVLGRRTVIHHTPASVDGLLAASDVIAAASSRMRRLVADRGCDTLVANSASTIAVAAIVAVWC